MKSKNFLFTVDDFGINKNANKLIFEAFEKGVINYASVTVNMPGSKEALESIKKYPKVKFGLHLNLTEPVNLYILINKSFIARNAKEQIRILQSYVKKIIFINSHHNVHFWPSINRVVAPIAIKHGIQAIRLPEQFVGNALKPALMRYVASKGLLSDLPRLSKAWLDLDWYQENDLLERLSQAPKNCEISCHPLIFKRNQSQSTLQWLIDHHRQLS